MSRIDADITAAGEAGAEIEEVFAALAGTPSPPSDRYWAMAQYLSGGEGWRDAGAVLRGTFAGFATALAAPASGLTAGQEE